MVGTNIQTNAEVAIKLEPIASKHPQLQYEYKLYKVLRSSGTYRHCVRIDGTPSVDLLETRRLVQWVFRM